MLDEITFAERPARTPEQRSASRGALLGVALGAVPVIAVIVAVMLMGRTGYDELSRGYPGIPTSLTAGVLRSLTEMSSTVCVGALFYAAFIRPRRDKKRFVVSGMTDLRIARWASLVWACAAVLLIGVDGADIGGLPLSRLATPGAIGYLVEGAYRPGAWMFAAAIAFVIFCITQYVRTWHTTVILVPMALVALLAPVLVSEVLVGPNHDFGSDAAIFGTPATAIWTGLTVIVATRWLATGSGPSALARTRFTRVAVVCGAVTALTQMVIAAFEIAGWSHVVTATAALFGVKFALLAALGVVGLMAHRRKSNSAGPLLVGSFLLIGLLAVTVAMTRIPPPMYFVPTSISQVFLGFDINATPTLLRLMFSWRVSILFITLAATGILLYAWGVVRLRRRGDAWPVGRSIAWVLGWAVIVLTTSSGLGRYSSVSFSLHMLLHMLLNMLGPMLLVLGGAITLALRATNARKKDEPAGPHEWITALLNWKFMHAIYNPLHVFIVFVGSYYVLYLTPIFGEALRYHWAHQVMNLHFVYIGYLFYGLVIGVDKPPRPLPHIGKLGLVLAAMPFHAFFGVVIMSQKDIIAGLFYSYINAPWMTDLKHTQYVGGGIAWAAGEIPLLIVVIVLVTQWSRQDARQAKRKDRHLDSGIDDSFTDYNAMLEQLSHRSAPTTQGAGRTGTEPS